MKLIHKTHNAITGEETFVEVEETAAEKKAREASEAEQVKRQAENEAKATQKAALLDRLGITEAEANLLLS
jgi:hypothetical protein